jgi:hypothetical protein
MTARPSFPILPAGPPVGGRRGAAALAALLAVLAGAAAAEPAGAAADAVPEPVSLVPKARRMSTYTLLGRFEIATKDVTFETPPAYQESFAFWTGQMLGRRQIEVYEFVTVTQEPNPDGSVPFRRRLPRFNLEMERKGVPYAPYGPIHAAATSLEWEGTFDAHGVVREIRQVSGVDEPDLKNLAFVQMDHAFPVIERPRRIPIGGSFTEVLSLPMPHRLNILGLEEIHLRVARTYTLKRVERSHANFEVDVEYALDPMTPSTEPNTTCVISGGGTGDATFDLRRGVFLTTRLPTTLVIDIEAPLRRLPDQPEDHDPGKGKTHLELQMLVTGNQTVRRLWGDEED